MAAAVVLALLLLHAPHDTAAPAAAYRDPGARELVRRARGARDSVDRSIRAYRATVRERLALDLRALRRDRRLYRRELALRVEWRRDEPGRIDVLGAREEVPVADRTVRVPRHLRRASRRAAYDPAGDRLLLGPDDTTGVRHPLADGSEAHYRFATGDTTTLGFPDGRVLRLVALHVTPRRADPRLVRGTLWLETDRYAVVRALLRPAGPFEITIEGAGLLDVVLPAIRGEIRLALLEYALWDQRWWLPRRIAVEAVATVGTWIETPFRYEREYDDYEVESDTAAGLAPRGAVTDTAPPDSAVPPFEVRLPDDTASLLASAALPVPFPEPGGASAAGDEEIERLARELRRVPGAPAVLQLRPPRALLARYNRVEGLSLGARIALELGASRLGAAVRLGVADLAPRAELGLERAGEARRVRVVGYERLAVVQPGQSLAALLLGRDDGDYYRATGAELTLAPTPERADAYLVRLYAERQRGTAKHTDASLVRVLDGDQRFRPNLDAAPATQIGVETRWRVRRGGVGAEAAIDVARGTFDFARGSLTLRAAGQVSRSLAAALELAGGVAAGVVAAQHEWRLGGAHTLRGYSGGASAGDSYWRVRAELGTGAPGARLMLFGDAGLAGGRAALFRRRPLLGVGIGLSVLDGLVRLDVARATRAPVGWRLEIYTDALL